MTWHSLKQAFCHLYKCAILLALVPGFPTTCVAIVGFCCWAQGCWLDSPSQHPPFISPTKHLWTVLWAHIEESQVVKINVEPSTMVSLITLVLSWIVEPDNQKKSVLLLTCPLLCAQLCSTAAILQILSIYCYVHCHPSKSWWTGIILCLTASVFANLLMIKISFAAWMSKFLHAHLVQLLEQVWPMRKHILHYKGETVTLDSAWEN